MNDYIRALFEKDAIDWVCTMLGTLDWKFQHSYTCIASWYKDGHVWKFSLK